MDYLNYYDLESGLKKQLSDIYRDIDQIDILIQSAESAEEVDVLKYLQYTRRELVISCENLENKLQYINSRNFNGPVLPLFIVPYIRGPVEPSNIMDPIEFDPERLIYFNFE
jgi:hypothetical protein